MIMTEIADRLKPIAAVVLCVSMVMGVLVVLPSDVRAGLPTDAWITGTVTDGTNPLPNVYIKVMLFMANGLDVNYSFTDAEGNYTVGVLGGFDYMVLAANGSYYMTFSSVSVEAGETANCNFTMVSISPLVADVTIKGFVKDEFGNPATAGHVLGLSNDPMGGDMPYYANVTTPDVMGYFQTNVLAEPNGGGAVAFDFPGYGMISNETSTPLVGGSTYWFNITLTSPSYNDDARIYGYVTDYDTGLPLAGVLVQCQSWNEVFHDYSNITFTDSAGFYEMNVLNSNYSTFYYVKSGYSMFLIQSYDVNTGDNIRKDVQLIKVSAVVKGNVTDLSTGLGMSIARVFVLDGRGNASMTQTNSTGYFELNTFNGTGLYMGAEADGYSRNATIISISPGDVIWQDFGLRPIDCWLVGIVTDYLTGLPIQNAWVRAESAFFEESKNTTATGYYNLSLVSGEYKVDVNAMNYRNNFTTVDVPALTETTHDVALLPWDLPDVVRLHGWVNDTSGLPIVSAEVRTGLPDGGDQNWTNSNATGYFEMMAPAVPLLFRATSWNHAPEFGSIDLTGLTEYRMDIVLGADTWGPNVTYSQSPTENITWDRPTVIDATVQEMYLQNMGLLHFMYWMTSAGQNYFYIVSGSGAGFDVFPSGTDLNYTVVGDVYTVHAEWNATLRTGGWLMNSTAQSYIAAYEIRTGGSQTYYALRAYYRNSTIDPAEHGTAVFDKVTGDFLSFSFDNGGMYPEAGPGDPTAVLSPDVQVITQNVTNPTMWGWVGGMSMGDWSTIGLQFSLDMLVPTGQYRTLFYANDWGQHGWASSPVNLTVDNGMPVADAGSDETVVVDTQVELNGTLSTDDVGIVSYSWNFTDGGNGYTVAGEVQQWTFATIGDHLVTLTVTDGAGHQSISNAVITVVPDEPPVANAGPDQSGIDEDTIVTFDGSGSYDDVGVAEYNWTIIELGENVLGVSPQYNFTEPGTYRVNLTVTDTIGQQSIPDQMIVTVIDVTAPMADAGFDAIVNVGVATNFDGSGSTDNVGIVNYTWTFTYGATTVTIYGMTSSVVFPDLGSYTITLTVRDAVGLSDSDTVVFTVIDAVPPNAVAGPDQAVVTGSTVTLNGSSSTDNIGVTNYTWTFNDAGAKILYGEVVTYQFDNAGQFIITLTVRDAAGNSDIDTVVVDVSVPNAAPYADAGTAQVVDEGDTVTFSGSGSTDDHAIASYTWTFLYDGQTKTLTGVSPSFTFNISGVYVVTLTVTDAEGLMDTDTVSITVQAGEETPVEKSFIEQYWWALALVAVLVIGALLFFMMKGRGGSAGSESQEENVPRSMKKVKEAPPPEDEEL